MLITKFNQSGLSLIESMISLLVISVGLLGIAGLQANALKQNSSSYYHTQSVLIGQNMADRIRANQVVINNYVGVDTDAGYNHDCQSNSCNPNQILLSDATDWTKMVKDLPSGRGIIRSPVANQLDIVVFWDDDGTGATGTNCGTNKKTDLTCYTVTMSTL